MFVVRACMCVFFSELIFASFSSSSSTLFQPSRPHLFSLSFFYNVLPLEDSLSVFAEASGKTSLLPRNYCRHNLLGERNRHSGNTDNVAYIRIWPFLFVHSKCSEAVVPKRLVRIEKRREHRTRQGLDTSRTTSQLAI